MLYEIGKYKEAIDFTNRELEINPKCLTALQTRAAAKFSLNDFTGGIEDCTQYLIEDPNSYELYTMRANAKEEMGDINGAKEDRERAKKLEQSE